MKAKNASEIPWRSKEFVVVVVVVSDNRKRLLTTSESSRDNSICFDVSRF